MSMTKDLVSDGVQQDDSGGFVHTKLRQYSLELPDLQNPKNVKILRAWDGDKNSMARIKTKMVQNPSAIPLAPATASTTNKDVMDITQ